MSSRKPVDPVRAPARKEGAGRPKLSADPRKLQKVASLSIAMHLPRPKCQSSGSHNGRLPRRLFDRLRMYRGPPRLGLRSDSCLRMGRRHPQRRNKLSTSEKEAHRT